MKILVTGAFGNIGRFLVNELLARKYDVRCFDLSTKRLVKEKFKRTEIFYGDIRKISDIKKAVNGCDAVIHLAFTNPNVCRNNVSLAHKINVSGTKNLVKIVKESPRIRFIFSSSISAYFYELYNKTSKINSLRYKEYAKQKLECEEIIKSSLSNWSILRIGAVLPSKVSDLKDVFSIPYDVYFRFIDIRDVAIALTNAIENDKSTGKTLLIGGGKGLCMRYKKFINDVFLILGKQLPRNNDFSPRNYLTECFNTKESQKILRYQKHSYKNFLSETKKQISKNCI